MLKLLAIIVYFWNVENFFAPGEFPGHEWSGGRFYAKCNAVAKTLCLAADACGALPDIVGLAEVGDASVLKALLGATPLRKLDYSFVHYDSPDRRGIDCALLYRRSRFRLLSSKPCHLYDSTGAVMRTRDILLVVLETKGEASLGGSGPGADSARPHDTLAVLVNHHPSKVGAGSGDRRGVAMSRLRYLADSLQAAGISRIIAVGDFNDEVVPAPGISRSGAPVTAKGLSGEPFAEVFCESIARGGSGANGCPRKPMLYEPPGTIKFQGKWEKIDGCPLLEGARAEEYIFAPQCLLERDSHGGEKPRRTFSGPRYLGGVSDHLPVFYILSEKSLSLKDNEN